MTKSFDSGYIVHVSKEDYERITGIIERYQKNVDNMREQQRAAKGIVMTRVTKPKPKMEVICEPNPDMVVSIEEAEERVVSTVVETKTIQTRVRPIVKRKPLTG